MYRIGLAHQFGLDSEAPAALLLPNLIALWVNDETVYVERSGSKVDIADGYLRVAATICLSICREPALLRWARPRPLHLIPNFPWATEHLDAFQQRVVQRLSDIQRLNAGGGIIEAIIWDWVPGQVDGRCITTVVGQRVFNPFYLRGHTLGYQDRVSNVMVAMKIEMQYAVKNTEPLNGELFPDRIDEEW
jgi:hypothetical protein